MEKALLLLLLPCLFHAQSNADQILGLMSYRNELIATNPEGFKKIYTLEDLWKKENEDAVGQLLLNIVYAREVYGISAKKIIKKIPKSDPDFPLLHFFTEENIEAIAQNKDLIDMLHGGFLKPDPPFQIAAETSLFQELDFYGIKNGMAIAEIGAGNGMFSLLLGLGHDSLEIYVNDIDATALHYAAAKINRCTSRKASNEYFMAQGTTQSTELKNNSVDKIIIRNSFHHFLHKKEMLESIKLSLSPNGALYIFDPIIYPDELHGCQEVMQLDNIKKILLDNGFEIVEERIKEDWGWVLLHCLPTKNSE